MPRLKDCIDEGNWMEKDNQASSISTKKNVIGVLSPVTTIL